MGHRIVYALKHGVDPGSMLIDHVDGDGLNNKPRNLRLATQSENLRNCGAQCNNTSGHKGVSWHRNTRKWCAQITLNGRRTHLGYFSTAEEAAAAYATAAHQLHGVFAPTL